MGLRALCASCIVALILALTACGGTPRAATANLGPVLQPTPDPTLDAVVRNLPAELAGTPPTPTPPPPPTATVSKAKPAQSSPKPTATPVRARR